MSIKFPPLVVFGFVFVVTGTRQVPYDSSDVSAASNCPSSCATLTIPSCDFVGSVTYPQEVFRRVFMSGLHLEAEQVRCLFVALYFVITMGVMMFITIRLCLFSLV
eukprot:Lithocolla_globosa_v1_NODE_1737_length_2368_cov_6.677182.p3 type:complete len:106 gc:universal NODE_1737_length_2368_cov_6.677182:324-641(+)